MEIKFIQILPERGGDYINALFQVDDKKIKIGITNTLRAIWGINPEKEINLAIEQIGRLKIMLMIVKDEELKDYMFNTYDFQENGHTLNFGEAIERLKNEILKANEKKHQIGFKPK